MLCFNAQAQSIPLQQAPVQHPIGRIYGTVTDSADNVVMGAHVTLISNNTKEERTLITGSSGFFDFTGLDSGKYQVSITSVGFAAWTASEIVLTPGQYYEIPRIQLQIATANTSVRVVFSQHDLAEKQMHVEEKQRILGVVPNFYTSYVWDAEPLTSGQKFRLALRTTVDPATFLGTGIVAGIEQAQNTLPGYGQGAQGYAKRYGASYTDGLIGIFLGGAVFPTLLHQDPRYFYKGTGNIRSRIFYALSTVVICKGDNHRWQPNYSNVLGIFAAAGASNAYYPPADRGISITLQNSLLDLAGSAGGALVEEFLIRKISRGVPRSPAPQP